MSQLNEGALKLWQIFADRHPFWKDDDMFNGSEPLQETVIDGECWVKWEKAEATGTLISVYGVYLTEFDVVVPIPSLVKDHTRKYYEVWALSWTPATRDQPEDADPALVWAGMDPTEAFFEFLKEQVRVALFQVQEGEVDSF